MSVDDIPDDQQQETASRTLRVQDVVTGCSGACLGAIVAPLLLLWWLMSTWNMDGEIGPLTIPSLTVPIVCFGALLGWVLGKMLNKMIKRRTKR